ncbi:MAG: ABC transporter permease [Chloroflexi bacterium]|nr:ABC transporter permease [Chloroflexota bacterium]
MISTRTRAHIAAGIEPPLFSEQNWRIRGAIASQEFGVTLVLIAMVLYLSYKTDTFTTPQSLQNIALAMSWIAIAAFGQTLVIITGGIDLSVGSVMALSGLVAAYYISGDKSPYATLTEFTSSGGNVREKMLVPDEWRYVLFAMLLGCSVGVLVGLINGVLIAYFRLPPFIATLGMMSVARGFCTGVTKGETLRNFNEKFMEVGRGEYIMPENVPILEGYRFPYPALIMLVICAIMTIFLARTIWGYRTYAVGGNAQAAELSGIHTRRVLVMVYTFSGFLGGVGGVLLTSRLGSAAPDAAMGYELQVIVAVVIGGTSLTGGKGTVIGTLIGAIVYFVLRSGLNLLKYDAYWQEVAIGAMIIMAIMFDQIRIAIQNRRMPEFIRIDRLRGLVGRRPAAISDQQV